MKLDFRVLLSMLSCVNTLSRIIFGILISLTVSVSVFANSTGKDSNTARLQSGSILITEDEESVTEEKKEQIKETISSFIIDSYKAQGDKILKDIDQTLQKTTPNKDDRIEAYKKIRISLEARRERNNLSKKVSETSKFIVGEFLLHMIDSIDKRISDLSK